MTDMTTTPTPETIARKLVPATLPGWSGLRHLVEAGIENYIAAQAGEEPSRQRFLPTTDANLNKINSAADLEMFRGAHRMRLDWHEPDEQGIGAYVIGNQLDNAMGPTVDRNFSELNVVLAEERDSEGSVTTFEPVAVVNLATLLSWATDGARKS